MSNFEERLAKIREANERTIRTQGYMVENVFPTDDSPGPFFNYSIGLHAKGLPEIIVLGLPLQVGNALINEVAKLFLAQKAMGNELPNEIALPQWPVNFALLPADLANARELAVGAHTRSGGVASFLQIVWPDKEGRMPWASGVTDSFREAQPLLGVVR